MPSLDTAPRTAAVHAARPRAAAAAAPPPFGVREQALPVTAPDGYPLGATLLEPEGRAPGPTVVLNGATGVPHRFYLPFGRYLAGHGARVLAWDYRGVGASLHGPVRKVKARMEDWGTRDFEGVLRYLRGAFGVPRVHVVGHSVGGQLAPLAQSAGMVASLAGVGAQLGDVSMWPRKDQLVTRFFWHGMLGPVSRALGYYPAGMGVGEALPGGVALQWREWALARGYFFGTEGGEARRAAYQKLQVPVLALSLEGDFYAPSLAVDAWAQALGGERVRREHLEDRALGHFGLFRRQHAQHWERLRSFLQGVHDATA